MPAIPPLLPELPTPSDTAGSWPTFSLSLAERRAISGGTVRNPVPNFAGQPFRSSAARPPTVYPSGAPYAPTQPTAPYTPPRRKGNPCLVATIVSLVLLVALTIGAVFVVPPIIASKFKTGSTPTPGIDSPTAGPGGSSPTSVPVTITVYPLTLTATNGSSTSDCSYWGPFFGTSSGWECGIKLQNNGQSWVNWRATGPPEVGFQPGSAGFIPDGESWTVTMHLPLKDCPGSITITITPDGGTPQNVLWHCS
jgi:hypothetical protein